jgi:hypothetical protein
MGHGRWFRQHGKPYVAEPAVHIPPEIAKEPIIPPPALGAEKKTSAETEPAKPKGTAEEPPDPKRASKLKEFLPFEIGALILAMAAAALTPGGVISMLAVHVCLGLAAALAVIGPLIAKSWSFRVDHRLAAAYVFMVVVTVGGLLGMDRWIYSNGPFPHPDQDFPILVPSWDEDMKVFIISVAMRGSRPLQNVDVAFDDIQQEMFILDLHHVPEEPYPGGRIKKIGAEPRAVEKLTVPELRPDAPTITLKQFRVHPMFPTIASYQGFMTTRDATYEEYIKMSRDKIGERHWSVAMRVVDTKHRFNLINCVDPDVAWPATWERLGDEKPCNDEFRVSISPMAKGQMPF